jgi:hypothetical protein
LAALQAQMIKEVIFNDNRRDNTLLPILNPSESIDLLTSALASILIRVSDSCTHVVIVESEMEFISMSTPSRCFKLWRLKTEETKAFILKKISLFQSKAGCMIFLMSLILSRYMRIFPL